MKFRALLLAALMGSTAAQAATELVTNGSFETSSVASGSFASVSSLAGWTIAGKKSTVELRNDLAGTAESGSVFAELDSSKNTTISQVLSTVVGETYTLSFWYASRPGVVGNSLGLQWLAGSETGTVDTHTGLSAKQVINATADNIWVNFTTSFVANSTSTALSFTGLGKSDGLGTSLDNISVTQTSVPEPTSISMLFAGLVAMGLMSRRKPR